MNSLDEESNDSGNTMPDISLGSLENSFKSPLPVNLRQRRGTSSSSGGPTSMLARLRTPSPPRKGLTRKLTDDVMTPRPGKHSNGFLDDKVDEDTQTDGDRRWESDSPALTRTKRSRSTLGATKAGGNMTLREQEKVIDQLKKDNFSLKLKVHFLEERLATLTPDHMEAALKQNIQLKIELQSLRTETRKYKKLILDLERELERGQQQRAGDSSSRERELEQLLEQRDREIRELRRRKSGGLKDDVALREAQAHNEELEQRQIQLEEELINANAQIEDNLEEMEELRQAHRQHSSGSDSLRSEGRKDKLERTIIALEADNELLKDQLEELTAELGAREEEKEELADKIESLSLHIEELERRQEAAALERSQSRADVIEEQEEREGLHDTINSLRDKLAAANIELQQKEEEISAKTEEIDEIIAEHESIVRDIENNWRGEVEEARQQVEEMRDMLAEREKEEERLREQVADFEENTAELHSKFEAALAHMEAQADAREEEIIDANQQITELSEKLWKLEETLEQERDTIRIRLEEDEIERERAEMVISALKDKLSAAKEQLQETNDSYESCRQEILAHREREEELARHATDLADEIAAEREAREETEAIREELAAELDDFEEKFKSARKEWEESARRERRLLDETESALTTARHDLQLAKDLLSQRESDIAEVQSAVGKLEAESRRFGQDATSDRFALSLEADRLRRDVARAEEEVTRLKGELEDRDSRARDREIALDRVHAENRDLASQLAAQTQARLNLGDKLDSVQASLKSAEAEVANLKAKVADLETRLSKDQRNQLSMEHQYRDQLTERNTLLLTVYQYLDKILGVERTTKTETKPFTNFAVFHDNLISRLKAVTNIQGEFDKRCKEIETKFLERLSEVKKQLDFRWKQLDRFETSVKNLVEVKHSWRKKYSTKEGELEAAKAANNELSTQLAVLKKNPASDQSEIRALTARAANAERRLTNAQNQLATTEERINSINEKTASADTKWEARVREYEARLKAAEERVKRERQGGKERIGELEANVSKLQRQLEVATRRNQQLTDVVDAAKAGETH